MAHWSPKSLKDALAVLNDHQEDITIISGGTDLMVWVEMGLIKPNNVLNIWSVPELRGICEDSDHVIIGATSTYTQIIESPLVNTYLPTLIESARLVGAKQIQNRGTLGGNLGNASPAADTPPVLLAAGGYVDLVSQRGRRRVALDDFFKGYRSIDRAPDELIATIGCRKKSDSHHDWFHKVGTRQAQSISKVVMGGRALRGSDGRLESVRLAAGSIAATTIRLPKTEEAMTGQLPSESLIDHAGAVAMAEVSPIDDVRSTAAYRSRVTGNLVRRWIRALNATA